MVFFFSFPPSLLPSFPLLLLLLLLLLLSNTRVCSCDDCCCTAAPLWPQGAQQAGADDKPIQGPHQRPGSCGYPSPPPQCRDTGTHSHTHTLTPTRKHPFTHTLAIISTTWDVCCCRRKWRDATAMSGQMTMTTTKTEQPTFNTLLDTHTYTPPHHNTTQHNTT